MHLAKVNASSSYPQGISHSRIFKILKRDLAFCWIGISSLHSELCDKYSEIGKLDIRFQGTSFFSSTCFSVNCNMLKKVMHCFMLYSSSHKY